MARFISQDSVAEAATAIVKTAGASVDITGAWITGSALRLLLHSIRSKIEGGQVSIRMVCRLHGLTDLDITDLGAIKEYEQLGAQVRFSRRLHAKMVLVDGKHGLVSSSNLTSAAGYVHQPETQSWTNFEAGIVLEPNDAQLVADATAFFERVWADSIPIDARAFGVAIGEPTTTQFDVIMVRPVKRSQYVVAECEGGSLLGKVDEIRTINVSFPDLEQPAAPRNSTGYNREPLPDLRTLFAGESKEQGFLKLTTFFDPASAFSIARVRVLKQRVGGQLRMPLVPTAPGAIVQLPDDDWLLSLQGEGELEIGRALNHETVPVRLRASELLRRHCAVYGMTGAGKSNGLKVLLRSLITWVRQGASNGSRQPVDLRVMVIDTHGEYASSGTSIDANARNVHVVIPDAIDLLDEVSIKSGLKLAKTDPGLKERIWAIKERLEEDEREVTCAAIIDELKQVGATRGSTLDRIFRAFERDPDRFAVDPQPQLTDAMTCAPESFGAPGLYIVNLSKVHDETTRADSVAYLMEHVFQRAKETDGGFETLFVVDEAQNFAPESGIDPVRSSLDAMLRIAREGRKFGVGLIISSQRPANINTGLRSQCNTHLIFRLVNANDLAAIADTVEAADRALVETMLPQLDVGTCFACGTAIDSPFFAEVPLFDISPGTAEMDGFGRAISEEASVFSIGDGPFDRSDRIGPK
jgi:DNA helicase HerA-like ATPase